MYNVTCVTFRDKVENQFGARPLFLQQIFSFSNLEFTSHYPILAS